MQRGAKLTKAKTAELGLQGKIDLADGQGFVVPSRLKDLRKGFGGGFNVGTVMKPVYYGVDSNGNQVALKYSTIALTDSLVSKHRGLNSLRKAMEASEVDELVMKSGVKIGSPTMSSSLLVASAVCLSTNTACVRLIVNDRLPQFPARL